MQVTTVAAAPLPIRPSARKVRRMLPAITLCIPLALTSGCAGMPKETSLSMGGALAGAAVGAQHGGLRGALVGAVIGGIVGNRIGAHLDEEDRKRLAEVEQKVLATGKSASFVTNKSKATLTVEAEPVKVEVVRTFKLGPAIDMLPLTTRVPLTVAAWVDTPLFNGTDEKAVPVATVAKGGNLVIEAQVTSNQQWMAVVDSDTVIGYVPARYLDAKIVKREKERLAREKTLKDKLARAEKARLAKAKGGKAPALAKAAQPAAPAAPAVSGLSLAKLTGAAPRLAQAMGSCRVLKRKVDTGNKDDSVKEEVKYCQEPPPKWKTITA